jgi:hypothetical protein
MSSIPCLSAVQWRKIESLLPPRRRDRRMIAALLFREFDGCGMREVCDLYGVTRTRLSEWTAALEADGTLARLMRELGLRRAGVLRWSAGGPTYWRRVNPDRGAGVLALKLDYFRAALRTPRRKPRRRKSPDRQIAPSPQL